MDCESVIDQRIDPKYLKIAKEAYQDSNDAASDEVIFAYSHALISSTQKSDIRQGISMFEKLLRGSRNAEESRTNLYYLALGHARVKDYDMAVRSIDLLLEEEPENVQAKKLKKDIKSKMIHDGLIGATIVGGGVAVAVAGALALFSLARK